MQYLCQLHDDDTPRPASISVMVVETGETLNICLDCQPTWALIVAGTPPDLVDQALEAIHAVIAAASNPPAVEAKPARRRRTAEQQEADVADDLADRGDSAATSEVVVPWPDHPPRFAGD